MDATTLEYGSPDTPEPRRRPHVLAIVVCAVLTLVAVSTCARIEWLNAQSGFYLPRAASDIAPWRTLPSGEQLYRLYNMAANPTLASRPLSPEERRFVRRVDAQNKLRDLVTIWGLAQYAVVPTVLAMSLRMLLRRPTLGALVFAATCFSLGLLCGAAMLYRGYFTSLRW